MYQLTTLSTPDVNTLVKTAGREELAVRTERHRIDRFGVLRQRVDALASLYVPQTYRGVERCTGQYKIHVGIVGASAGGRPFDRVDFLRVSLKQKVRVS